MITAGPVSIDEITSTISSALATTTPSSRFAPGDNCSNVLVLSVGYLLNSSSQLHAEVHAHLSTTNPTICWGHFKVITNNISYILCQARFFSLPAARSEPYGANFALYSRSLPRAKAVSWIRDRSELSYKRDVCGVQETLLYRTGPSISMKASIV